MPLDFVTRWPQLSNLVQAVGSVQDEIGDLVNHCPPDIIREEAELRFKSEGDYLAVITPSLQRRSRDHEKLVRYAAEYLLRCGTTVITQHPIDLLMTRPRKVIFEAKLTRKCNPLLAIREAVGQLWEYRYFVGPSDALLCVLLDKDPGAPLVNYVEQHLGISVVWFSDERLICGPKTGADLLDCGFSE
jgi:hypothetical protein